MRPHPLERHLRGYHFKRLKAFDRGRFRTPSDKYDEKCVAIIDAWSNLLAPTDWQQCPLTEAPSLFENICCFSMRNGEHYCDYKNEVAPLIEETLADFDKDHLRIYTNMLPPHWRHGSQVGRFKKEWLVLLIDISHYIMVYLGTDNGD